LPDKVFKSNQIKADETRLVLTNLGPEEKFAGNVLKSLKQKISEARTELQKIQTKIEQKRGQAKTEAEEIIKKARQEAEQIVEQAEEEAREIINSQEAEVDQAREEGYDDGYEEGWEKARQETATMLEHSEDILNEARRERQAFIEKHEEALISLAASFAEKVVRHSIELDEDVASRTIRAMLEEVRDVKEITLILNPEDCRRIREIIDDYVEEHPSIEEITISPNENMDRGGCRIKTEFGDFDGSIRGQLDHLVEQLVKSL